MFLCFDYFFLFFFFFFQAEDGIRDHCVTGVQTCALPIYGPILVVDRLLARLEVDDAQAPMTEERARVRMVPAVVGSAMRQRRRHPLDQRNGARRCPVSE